MIGLGGTGNSIPRESGFDITPASEVMATLCFSESLPELKARLGRIVVAYSNSGKLITARDLKADGAMTVLMRYGVQPNLVQTLEGNPALIHGGPFGNIAHGCNTVTATKLGMRLADYTVTEAGFRRGPRRGEVRQHQVPQEPGCARTRRCWSRRSGR